MATYVTLISFTDQGIRNVKDSPDRLAAFKALADKSGVKVTAAWYTVGSYDLVTVTEGSDEAIASVLLKSGSLGNVRTQSMRAYSVDEMRAILSK